MDAKQLLAQWSQGRASLAKDGELRLAPSEKLGLPAKFRRAYRWIAEQSLLPGALDMDWSVKERVSHNDHAINLPQKESMSSFVLLPLLTLMTSRRMVFIGAPGHGKTSMATIMGLLAGHSLDEVRKGVQHGHPQLTISDLLGSPLPSDLVNAKSTSEIQVAWRDWIHLRVKIIDEYNRIPTKTQSALLSLMAEGYAEMFEQVVETGRSAWFLTANDDLGGGTFPVIEALKDRIDLVVRCAPFHSRYLRVLADRVSNDQTPQQHVPDDVVFTPAELDEADRLIREIEFPDDVLELLGFFLGQLDFCQRASTHLEQMNKDTLHLSGRRVAHVCTEDCPLDKHTNLCAQTENGVSPRAYQAIIHYTKALAFFRGNETVSIDDLRLITPWVLFDKLKINAQSEFFQKTDNKWLLSDRVGWLQQLFDTALQQHAAYQPIRQQVVELEAMLRQPAALSTADLQSHSKAVVGQLERLLQRHELNGLVHEDLMRLKMLYAKCQSAMAVQ